MGQAVTEENRTSIPNSPDSRMSLHDWVSLLCWLFGFLLAWIVLAIFANGLGDFLHAPIGIKDNPPEPGIVIQFARIACYPVVACFIALRVLMHFSGE